jgi:elongation factor G
MQMKETFHEFVSSINWTESGASFERSYASILDRLTKNAVRFQIPIGEEENLEGVIDLLRMKAYYFEGNMGSDVIEKEIPENLKADAEKYHAILIEKIVEHDDAMMMEFLDGKTDFDMDTLKKVARKAVIANDIVPVFAGSALKNKGVQLVLDGVVDYLPAPIDIPSPKGIHPDTGAELERKASDAEPFSALAFKVATDPFVGQLIFFRVYSGTLESGSYILNTRTGNKERIGRILRMHANDREEVKKVFAGDIAAAVGLKDTRTSDTLCDVANPIILEEIKIPEPVISLKIEPKTKADQEKMGMALSRLTQEDPTFRVTTDTETGDTIIWGMGELHLDIIVDRMRREFNVEANTGRPQVAYKETITGETEVENKYIKQSGGKGQYGHVKIRVKPLDYSVAVEDLPKNTKRSGGLEFINNIKGGVIPNEFIPAVEKGAKEAMSRGVLAGYPIVDLSVELYDGTYHDVDSSEIAFKIAASQAVQEAVQKARPVILEPMMNVEITVPEKFLGDITGNVSSKRGQIEGVDDRGMAKVVRCIIPLSEMFGYMSTLRSMTEGRASFNMEFSRYDIVPQNVADEVIKSRK